MSGQLLIIDPDQPLSPHGQDPVSRSKTAARDLRFTEQRTFGQMCVVRDGAELPGPIDHIAPRPRLEVGLWTRLGWPGGCGPAPGVSRALLDQSLISGVGKHLRRRGAVAGPAALGPAHETLNGPEVSRLLADGPRGARRGTGGRRHLVRRPVMSTVNGERERLLRAVPRGLRPGRLPLPSGCGTPVGATPS